MDKQRLREIINQLVESEKDLREVDTRRNEFEQTRLPPRPPNEFENLQAFVDFYEEKQGFEDEKQRFQAELEVATERHTQAENVLMGILPDNVTLTYDYVGERQEFQGVQFKITNQVLINQRRIIISTAGPATS